MSEDSRPASTRGRRRRLIFLLAAVSTLGALALGVHAPVVRGAVLRFVQGIVAERVGIRLEASRLDYNIATLRFGLQGVRLSATGNESPFFEADYVSVVVPLRVLRGEIAVDELTVSNGVVRVSRDESGSWNLPSGNGNSIDEPPAIAIGLLDVSDLRIDVRDAVGGVRLATRARMRMSPDEGRIELLDPASLVVGDVSVEVRPVEFGARFDGRTIHLSGLVLEIDGASAALDGAVTVIARNPSADLRVNGAANLSRLPGIEALSGEIAVQGALRGPMDGLSADFQASAPKVEWQSLMASGVEAHGRASADEVVVESLTFRVEGGEVSLAGALPLGESEPMSATASWSGVNLSGLLGALGVEGAILPSGMLSGTFQASGVAGQLESWSGEADLRITDGANAPGRVTVPGRLALSAANGAWRVRGEHHVGGSATTTVDLEGRFGDAPLDSSALAGTVDVAPVDLEMLFSVARASGVFEVPESPIVSGSIHGHARVSGSVGNPQLDVSIAGEDVSVPPLSATGSIALSGPVDVRQADYSLQADLTDWRIAPTQDRPLSASLDGRASVSGRGADVRAEVEMTSRNTIWQDIDMGEVAARVNLADRRARVTMTAPGLASELEAELSTDAPYQTTIDVRTVGLDLGPFAERFEVPVMLRGVATLTTHAEGTIQEWLSGSASVDLLALDGAAGDLPVRLTAPARIRYESARVLVEGLEASVGDTMVSVAGDIEAFASGAGAGGLVVTATGGVAQLMGDAARVGLVRLPDVAGSGPVAVLARVDGSLETPTVSGDIEIGPGTLTFRSFAAVSDLSVRAHAGDGWLDLTQVTGRYQGASINGSGRVPLSMLGLEAAVDPPASASVRATATGISPSVLDGVLDATTLEGLAGSIDLSLELESRSLELADVQGALQLDRFDLQVSNLPVGQRTPTRIVARDGLARVESWDWTGQGAELGVRGQVGLGDLQADLQLNGTLDLRMLTPFVRDAGLTTAGRLVPRVSIAGLLSNPRFDGELLVSDGQVRVLDPRIIVSDLSVRALLAGSVVRLTELAGSVNGGTLTGAGEFEFGPGAPLTGSVSADVQGMALEFPQGLRSEVNAALRIAGDNRDGPQGRLEGTVTVVRGVYREPLAVATGLLARLRTRRVGRTFEDPGALGAVALNVRVITDEDIIVDNNYGRFQVGADLRAIGTVAAPSLSGRLEVREGGRLFVGRNVYTVESGTVDFVNPVTIEPDLDVDLRTRAGGEDIEVAIAGTPANVQVDLRSTSNPDLGQADLTALLLTGRSLDRLNDADAATIGTQMLGNLSADVLGFAGRAVGLDTLRIEDTEVPRAVSDPTVLATNVDPTSRLTMGRSFGSTLDVTLSQSLRDSAGQTWIVEYLPGRQVELRLISDDDNLRSYGFRHDVAFRGSRPARSTEAPVRRIDRLEVVAVVLEGNLIFPEQRLRRELRLEPGDRFDPAEWQEERFRLEEFYQAEGRLRAQVTARQTEGQGGVTLTYVVNPGPRTEIAVTGVDLSDAVRSRLRAAWTTSMFDEFLIEEARQIVERALEAEGYLQPSVEARLTPGVDAVSLLVDVRAGERTVETVVRIDGVDETLRAQIEALVSRPDVAGRAVTDPEILQAEVMRFLRGRGHLRARVVVGAPIFSVRRATVPVSIVVGEVVLIGRIRFEGAVQLSPDRLMPVTGLEEGSPVDPAAVDDAAERVAALYRSEAFSAVSVVVDLRLRESEPLADVSFMITEGPQQILTDVVITGNRGVDTEVIERALSLSLNEPLRPDEWLRARTRVFRMGLFRRADIEAEPVGDSSESRAPMRVTVTVEEWPALRLRYGFQIAEERPEENVNGRNLVPGLSADVSRRTLFGRALTLGSAVEYQRREQVARVFATAPSMFGRAVQSSLVLERSHRDFAAETTVTDLNSLSWSQRTRVAPRVEISYAYRWERNHTFDTESTVIPGFGEFQFDETTDIAKLSGSAAWDTRDDVADSTRGWLLSSNLETSASGLGSDLRFIRSLSQAYYFRSWRQVVFASAARVGVVRPLGGQNLDRAVRFVAGGARTVRGIPEDSLRDRALLSDGESLLLVNHEVRVPVYRWLRGVAFVDLGNVFADSEGGGPGGLAKSAGVGIRLITPFGVLRADYGRAFSNVPTDTQPVRWTFGIGNTF